MTKADPDPQAETHGRHASSRDRDDEPAPPESSADSRADDDLAPDDGHQPEDDAIEGDAAKDDAPDDDAAQDDAAADDARENEAREDDESDDEALSDEKHRAPSHEAPDRDAPDEATPRSEAPASEAPQAAAVLTQGATRARPAEDRTAQRSFHPIGDHPAGVPLLIAAGLVTGLSLAPLLLDRLRFSVALEAAANASSVASPWPAGAQPWFLPGWAAATAFFISAAVLVLALVGLRLPDLGVFVLAAGLTVFTAWAALATLDVLEQQLWELLPVCILCVIAFGLAATATGRWRSPPEVKGGEGAGGVASAALAAWLVVVLVLLAGAAIAASARTNIQGVAPTTISG